MAETRSDSLVATRFATAPYALRFSDQTDQNVAINHSSQYMNTYKAQDIECHACHRIQALPMKTAVFRISY